LCGQKDAEGVSKKEPCNACQSAFPNFKSCRSCGRCFTDAQHFTSEFSERCITCEKRRKRKHPDSKTTDERIKEKKKKAKRSGNAFAPSAALTDKKKNPKRSDNDFGPSAALTGTDAATPSKKGPRKTKRYLRLILDDSTLVGKMEIIT